MILVRKNMISALSVECDALQVWLETFLFNIYFSFQTSIAKHSCYTQYIYWPKINHYEFVIHQILCTSKWKSLSDDNRREYILNQ